MDVMKQGSDRAEMTPGFQSKAMSALLKCVCILCCGKIASETGIAAWEDHKAGVLSGGSPLSSIGFVAFRELMLVAHQKSIEQMQETLRQKLLSDESWREKVTLAPISVCLVCFRNTLSFCQKAGPDRFHCYSEYFWFHLEFPTPNILKIYAFSKILDNVIRSKKGK